MKKNTKSIGVLVAFAALLSATPATAQTDTVRVKTTTTETETIRTDTVARTQPAPVAPAPAPAPAEPADEYRAPVRKTELGFRYYPTFSSLALRTRDGEVVEGNLSMSHGWGVFLGHNFNNHVGVILEVDYNEISQKFKDRNLDRTVNVSYLNIPVLLSLNTCKSCWVNWNFVAGPQFGLNIGSSVKTSSGNNSDTLNAVVGIKQGDVGFAYGTGLEFWLDKPRHVRLDVGFRGFYGLVDMSADQKSSNPDTYNIMVKAARRTYAAYIGITFGF